MSRRSEDLATYFKAVLKLSFDLRHVIDRKSKQLNTHRLSFKLVGEEVAKINATTNEWLDIDVGGVSFHSGREVLSSHGEHGEHYL